MRIISGYFKNLPLKYPKKEKLRPTTDKIRNAVFNIISANFPRKLHQTKVCDIFAGSGAFGIEALSRGAKKAIFIENNRQILEALSENLQKLSEFKKRNAELNIETQIIPADAEQGLNLLKNEQFDIIFLDPPYNQQLIQPVINKVVQNKLIASDGIIVIEHHCREFFSIPEGFLIFRQKQYGSTVVTIIIKKELENENSSFPRKF
ncbi:MAG: 16S rRNA (guanine(966)-N(2))-methyltransferase RsmD [candidate division WOR-3 bacterium]|nr:16S rRNA (guanine(966)-N(2))-methyltransferase RsmD [candidate division WOR-3 bacterium]